MGIVEFKFDREKDLYNIWENANTNKHYGYDFKKGLTNNILEICEDKEYDKCKKELVEVMRSLHNNPLVEVVVGSLNKAWNNIEEEYFERLESITKKKFLFKKVNAYSTAASRCPYNPDPEDAFFYFSFFWGLASGLHAVGHELMHIHLHNLPWWEGTKKELGNKKTHDLKEALTELLNSEFRDLWIVDDEGYPGHTKLRSYISLQWEKKKDFDLLTEKCIKWIKRNGVK